MASQVPPALLADIQEFLTGAQVALVRSQIGTHTSEVIKAALSLQSIPAPTFEERARAIEVARIFDWIGLSNDGVDEIGNVYGRLPGRDSTRPAVLVSAHLDTVFPSDVDLSTHEDPKSDRLYGPGLGDNSLGLAGMIEMARVLIAQRVLPASDIWWVATVGEEGLGNLRGIRQACTRLKDQLGVAIILEGMGIGRICHAGLGVRRLRVDVTGPGGHSWLASDRPSAIHHAMRIGSQLVETVKQSSKPKTSFNIGLMSGGTSINTRSPNASMSIDIRSESESALIAQEALIRRIVAGVKPADGIQVEVSVIGDRPSAVLSRDHPLVHAAVATLEDIEGMRILFETGSTDANIPLSMQIPSVCIGLTDGGNAHSLDEFITISPLANGLMHALSLTLLASEFAHEWSAWQ